jgi:hypothetical protein
MVLAQDTPKIIGAPSGFEAVGRCDRYELTSLAATH